MSTSKQYANVYVKTIFIGPRSIAGVPSSQALPGLLITAPPPVLVPAVLGAQAVWIQNQKKRHINIYYRIRGVEIISDCSDADIFQESYQYTHTVQYLQLLTHQIGFLFFGSNDEIKQ